jgi:hypothetical protein
MTRTYCSHCPMIGSCPRWPTNHIRYCHWVDPDHQGYRQDGAANLAEIAEVLASKPDPPDPEVGPDTDADSPPSDASANPGSG